MTSTTNTAASQAWLLYPSWLGYSETHALGRPADAYTIERDGDAWVLRLNDSGIEEYRGIGPIEIVDEPVPF